MFSRHLFLERPNDNSLDALHGKVSKKVGGKAKFWSSPLVLLEITGNKKSLKENLTKLVVRSFTTIRASFLLRLGLANTLE